MDKRNVTTGKPKTGGAVFHADSGTALPTDAVTALANTYVELGYCSEEGLKNAPELTVEDIKAWGGDVVESSQTAKADRYVLTLIESLNPEVLKVVHGADNVSGDLDTGIAVEVNSKEHPTEVYVVDMLMKQAVQRIVIPAGKVTGLAEVTYKDGSAVGYQVTITAYPDDNGNTHYEYTKATA